MDKPVGIEFRNGQEGFQFLETTSLSAKDDEYQRKVSDSIESLLNVGQFIRQQSIFSPNETLEDIQTNYLKFLLVDFYLAQLVLKRLPVDRMQDLKTAKSCFTSFLNQCERLGLLHDEDIEIFHREVNQTKKKRDEKIARYKREKELNQLLSELNKQRKNNQKQAENGYIVSNTEEEDEEFDDEEKQRELYLLLIKLATLKSMDELEATESEEGMLAAIEKMKASNGGKLALEEIPKEKFQNFTLLPSDAVKREQLKKDVFKPGYPLPTMTVEEWADQQMELGLLPSPGQQPTNNQKKKEKTDEPTDSETYKARAWDDYKDDNPKGAGNKNDNYFRR